MEILLVTGLFVKDEPIETLFTIGLVDYLIKIFLPWVQFKRKIGVDTAKDLIINTISYKVDRKIKE